MPIKFSNHSHFKETILLAWPVVLTQVGHVLTSLVDIIFLGKLGTAELAAGVLANSLYILVLVFCIGMSYALTPLVAEAKSNNNPNKLVSYLKNATALNFIVAVGCFLFLSLFAPFMQYLGQPMDVVEKAIPFFEILIFSMIPVSFFFTGKQFCEGISNTRIALFISVAGNLINIILNYGLIWGRFGLPELGYLGSAWASLFSRCFMGLAFVVVLSKTHLIIGFVQLWKNSRMNKMDFLSLWKIGINSALQFTFEVAAFAIAGIFCGTFGKEQLDGHGVALNLASFTYMFASGIGSAATIRASDFYAKRNWKALKDSAYASISLVLVMMGVFGIIFFLFNTQLPKLFTDDIRIVNIASTLLIIAALFQIFDGLQVTMIGILRGMQDVKFSTYMTLIGYWMVAIPLAAILAFNFKLASFGVWMALLIALIFVGVALLLRFNYLIKKFDN